MNIERLDRVGRRLAVVVVVLGFLVTLLCVALVRVNLREPRVVVVPGAQRELELSTGGASVDSVRAFALLYLARSENYTPSTVEATVQGVSAWIAPSAWSAAGEALRARAALSKEAQISSQIVLPSMEEVGVSADGNPVVTIVAIRRTYLADRPGVERKIRCRLVFERAMPLPGNPYGLCVAESRIEEEEPKK